MTRESYYSSLKDRIIISVSLCFSGYFNDFYYNFYFFYSYFILSEVFFFSNLIVLLIYSILSSYWAKVLNNVFGLLYYFSQCKNSSSIYFEVGRLVYSYTNILFSNLSHIGSYPSNFKLNFFCLMSIFLLSIPSCESIEYSLQRVPVSNW